MSTEKKQPKWIAFLRKLKKPPKTKDSTAASGSNTAPVAHHPANAGLFSTILGLPHDAIVLRDRLSGALEGMVDNSAHVEHIKKDADANIPGGTSQAPASSTVAQSWLGDLFDEETLDRLFAQDGLGNYVIIRKTGVREFESMPIYARIGMHLIFVHIHKSILEMSWVEALFRNASIKQGKIYDETDPTKVLSQIQSFVKTYEIDTSELLEKDLKKYPNFNSFFYRKLQPGARPVSSPQDLSVLTSVADCRLSVFDNVDMAKKFWIKSKEFTIPALLDMSPESVTRTFGKKPALALFRLAPQDYHRFGSPADAVLSKLSMLAGTYYTVNPQAVNEDLNVFAGNKRDVMLLSARLSPTATADESLAPTTLGFVAIGALLVAAINWTKKPGESIAKGEDLGYFAYGGSTVALVIPEGVIKWDDDLLRASTAQWIGEKSAEEVKRDEEKGPEAAGDKKSLGTEVLVKLGEKIGTVVGTGPR